MRDENKGEKTKNHRTVASQTKQRFVQTLQLICGHQKKVAETRAYVTLHPATPKSSCVRSGSIAVPSNSTVRSHEARDMQDLARLVRAIFFGLGRTTAAQKISLTASLPSKLGGTLPPEMNCVIEHVKTYRHPSREAG